MNELHLFAGAGGGILGGILLGHTCVCAVEIEPYCQQVLLQRQRDGILPKFPIWDDVRTFDGKPWRGLADVVCGGFPCQDISAANINAVGIEGGRSGLWGEMARVVGEVQPNYVLVENSPMLTLRGLGRVLGDLAKMGYDARWDVFSAGSVRAPILRRRIFILAVSKRIGIQRYSQGKNISSTCDAGKLWGIGKNRSNYLQTIAETPFEPRNGWPQPLLRREIDGVADWKHRLKSIGNGQVPAVVRLAWETLI